MKQILISTLIFLFCTSAAWAKIRVVATYPYIKDLTKHIGKKRVKVHFLAPGSWNPHYVVPRPSYIAKLRNADLLIMNGAEIEIGWLPPLLKDAGNADIRPGKKGFLDLSQYVKVIDVPKNVSRGQGDIHPSGNPHFYLDPYNVPVLAKAITNKLCEIDPDGTSFYRHHLRLFMQQWQGKLREWNRKLQKIKGRKIVQYHKQFDYFLKRYGLIMKGTLEPLPGIPPTSRHIESIINLIKRENINIIIQDVFNSAKPAMFVGNKTGAEVIILPHDVYSVSGVSDIFTLFDEIVRRLCND